MQRSGASYGGILGTGTMYSGILVTNYVRIDQKYYGFLIEFWLSHAMQTGIQYTRGKIHINMNQPVVLSSFKGQSHSSLRLVLAAFQ